MEITELLKTSIVVNIELHTSCLVLLILLYGNMHKSFIRNSRERELPLSLVYIGSMFMLISDCLWNTVSQLCEVNDTSAYIINLVYFISSSSAAACWFVFCTNHLKTKLSKNKPLCIIALIPYFIQLVLYLVSPRYGLIFSIQNGEYIRGNLFFMEPLIKMGYIIASTVLAFFCGKKKEVKYLRNKDFNFAFFALPVIICGVLQVVTGVDFNCLGVTFGCILIYITGITNPDSENTDALYSLANSFEASYIVNMESGLIRPLRQDNMHDKSNPAMQSMDYTSRFHGVLSEILLSEDRAATLEAFSLENIEDRFKIDNSFSIRYRVREESGQTSLHTASFIRATKTKGRQEFLLGINSLHADSLLYERNESLNHENRKLEQINANIIESVAKIVEARDSGSGEHIVRVKKLTEIIARQVMADCPEFTLNDEKIKLICSASVLHDVGKIIIPDAVLLKPGRFTDEEFEIMKTHSVKGCEVLNMFPLGLDDAFLGYAQSICRWHHEKYDGRGYPDRLLGEDIPIEAQIVSAADCFDALVSDRPYKEAYSPEKAFEMIVNGECGAFSPKIISAMEKQKSKLKELALLYS